MEDDVASAYRRMRTFVTLDVALHELDLVTERQKVLTPAGRKVVENADLIAGLLESPG